VLLDEADFRVFVVQGERGVELVQGSVFEARNMSRHSLLAWKIYILKYNQKKKKNINNESNIIIIILYWIQYIKYIIVPQTMRTVPELWSTTSNSTMEPVPNGSFPSHVQLVPHTSPTKIRNQTAVATTRTFWLLLGRSRFFFLKKILTLSINYIELSLLLHYYYFLPNLFYFNPHKLQ
jgi:hypothetical protein